MSNRKNSPCSPAWVRIPGWAMDVDMYISSGKPIVRLSHRSCVWDVMKNIYMPRMLGFPLTTEEFFPREGSFFSSGGKTFSHGREVCVPRFLTCNVTFGLVRYLCIPCQACHIFLVMQCHEMRVGSLAEELGLSVRDAIVWWTCRT